MKASNCVEVSGLAIQEAMVGARRISIIQLLGCNSLSLVDPDPHVNLGKLKEPCRFTYSHTACRQRLAKPWIK